jgi:hypothetical protein
VRGRGCRRREALYSRRRLRCDSIAGSMKFPATFRMNRGLKWAALVALSCAYSAESGVCFAQEEKSGARAAAAEGAKAFQEGRWADAIDFFTRAESLVHAPPHLLYIARSQKQTGLLVQARENLLAIVREELAPTAPHAFRAAQEDAKTELKDLEPRLPYVTLTIKGAGSSSVVILQDGNKVPSALVGVPRPVDPGSHTFEATAGSLKGRVSVDLKEAERKKVTLELGAGDATTAPAPTPPAPTPAPAAATPPPSEAPAAAMTEQPPSAPTPEADSGGGSKGLLIGGFVGVGLGLGGVALGAVMLSGASSKQDEANSLFNDNKCGAPAGCSDAIKGQISDADDKASSSRTLGIVGLAAGGAVLVAGGVLLVLHFTGKKSSSPDASVPTLHLAVAPSSIRLGGTF